MTRGRRTADPAAPNVPVLSRRALNRAYLARQLLLARATLPAEAVIEQLVGMQAQNQLDPYVGLWTRLEDFRPEELSGLIADRRAVRAVAMMRTTIHLLTARDWLALRPVLQVVQERGFWTGSPFHKDLVGLDMDEVLAAGRAVLDETPMTGPALGKVLAERWPGRNASSIGYAVRYLVPVVQIPPRGLWGQGGQPVLATAEHWLGQAVGTDASADTMVLRYLAAFGPASVMDIQAWSWLTRLGVVVERLRPRLRTFRDEQGRELFDVPDGALPDPDTPAPPRFLPIFDNLLLSHKDRSRVTADLASWTVGVDQFDRVFAGGSFLVDGFIAGGWRINRERGRATLVVLPIVPLSASDRAAVADEGARLLEFSAADATDREVTFEASA